MGNENTIVYASLDGENLMALDQVNGSHSLDMCSYSFSPRQLHALRTGGWETVPEESDLGTGIVYGPNAPSTQICQSRLSAFPQAFILAPGEAARASVVVAAQSGNFNQVNQAVALSCANLPPGMSCSFSPPAVVPGAGASDSSLTIAATQESGSLKPSRPTPPNFFFAFCLSLGVAVLPFAANGRGRRSLRILALASTIALAGSCVVAVAPSSRFRSSVLLLDNIRW